MSRYFARLPRPSLAELSAELLVVATVLLASCDKRTERPVVVVDPGPPFGPPPGHPRLRAVHVLDDGSVVLLIERRAQ